MSQSLAAEKRRERHPRTVRVRPEDRMWPTAGAWSDLCQVDGNMDFAAVYVLLDLDIFKAYRTRSGTLHILPNPEPATRAMLGELWALLEGWEANGWPSDADGNAALKRLTQRRDELRPGSAA